jgi:predicted component of type VI protein secretion system
MTVKLLVVSGDTSKKEVTLRRPRTVVGRKKGCKIRIQSESVSRIHCSLVLANGRLTAKDLGSSNGTFVNGRRIKEQELQAGDKLRVGVITFMVQIIGAATLADRPAQVEPEPTMAVAMDDDEVVFLENDQPEPAAGDDELVSAELIDEPADADADAEFVTEGKSQAVPPAENIFVQDDEPTINADDFVIPDSVLDEGAGYKLADSSRPGQPKKKE